MTAGSTAIPQPQARFFRDRLAAVRPATCALAAFTAVLLLQVELIFSKCVNWDEFYHFSDIHQHLMGRPTPLFQVPFVYLFSWVPSLPGDVISHIHFTRLLTLPFELATIAAIYLMAQRFASREAALVSALAYMTGGYVFLHGFALRADMIAAALLSVALWICLCRPLRLLELLAITALLTLACISTIKCVLYAPAFVGIALLRIANPRHRRALIFFAVVGIAAAGVLLAAGSRLPETGALGVLHNLSVLGNSSIGRMFTGGLFPQGAYLAKQIMFAPLLAVLLAIAAWRIWKSEREQGARIALVCLLLPLCTVAFYRNAFPYHFSFILPPTMVTAALGAEWAIKRYGFLPVCLLLTANALVLSFAEDRSASANQQVIQRGIHETFPKPVSYIDESGMIGDFPRAVNRFASGWALEGYVERKQPIYRKALEREPVPFLIVNSFALLNVFYETGHEEHLLPDDMRALRENFIPHWGQLHVAGKVIPPGTATVKIYMLVPGAYTVEGGAIVIDGAPATEGSVVQLKRGQHEISGSRSGTVTLRWGDHLKRPAYPWPEGTIFTDY